MQMLPVLLNLQMTTMQTAAPVTSLQVVLLRLCYENIRLGAKALKAIHFTKFADSVPLLAGPLVLADPAAKAVVGGATAVEDDNEVAAALFK